MKEIIGTNAGLIWEYLSTTKKKEISITDLRKECKLTIKDVYAALGWLAREGKVAFNEIKDDYEVALL